MKNKNLCIIIGSGDFGYKNIDKGENDIVICADGGYNHALKYNISVDYIVGDNDSIFIRANNIKSINYQKEKDKTDMSLSLEYGISLGYTRFDIYGGYGDRPDHFLANVQLIANCSINNCKARIITKDFTVYAISNSELIFNNSTHGKLISVFSLSDFSENVCINGLKYSLIDAKLCNVDGLGVSNQFLGIPSSISVENGCLIIFSYDNIANDNFKIQLKGDNNGYK